MPYDRLQRLEVTPRGIPPTGGEVGSLFSGPLRVQDKCTTTGVLQLEGRSLDVDNGCTVQYSMDWPLPLHVPSFLSGVCLPGQDQQGGSIGGADSSSVDHTALVPSAPAEVNEATNSSISHSGLGPEGQPHPLVLEGHLPLAAWPVSGDPSVCKDYQRELLAPGENPQSQHTLELGDCGTAGALNGALQPL